MQKDTKCQVKGNFKYAFISDVCHRYLCLFFFFVGSHKCAYPTGIALNSDRVDLLLYSSVFPNFPAAIRTHIVSQPSRLSASALDHSATVTQFRYLDESKQTFSVESFRPP